MGNLNMEATQIHYRHDSAMTVDKKLQNLESRVTTLEDGEPAEVSKADIAPVFSAETAYSAGDYVYHDGHLYKFTADHAAGAWSDLDTETAVVTADLAEQAGDIDELKSGLTTLDTEINGDAVTYPYADVITIEDAIPANLADCSVKIEPVQSGTGEPSPTNVRPITGHTEASVQRDGKNLAENNMSTTTFAGVTWTKNADGSITVSGKPTSNSYITNAFIAKVKPSMGKVTCSGLSGVTNVTCEGVLLKDANDVTIASSQAGTENYTVDLSNYPNVDYITASYKRIENNVDCSGTIKPQIEIGETATPFEPYAGQTYTIALGDTIYGAKLNPNTGVMTVDRAIVDLGTLDWAYNTEWGQYPAFTSSALTNCKTTQSHIQTSAISSQYAPMSILALQNSSASAFAITNASAYVYVHDDRYSDATAFKTAMDGVQICYELATPTTIQLTPEQIQLLKGTNTLYASTGQISVTVNGVSGAIGAVQTQANDTDAALAELAADIAEQLPTAPTTDGAYVLTVTVASGTPTYSWESAT